MYRVIGKVNMGMGLLECGILTLTPHLEPFPTSNQDVPGKTLPSVKSNWPAKATLGTMPIIVASPSIQRVIPGEGPGPKDAPGDDSRLAKRTGSTGPRGR